MSQSTDGSGEDQSTSEGGAERRNGAAGATAAGVGETRAWPPVPPAPPGPHPARAAASGVPPTWVPPTTPGGHGTVIPGRPTDGETRAADLPERPRAEAPRPDAPAPGASVPPRPASWTGVPQSGWRPDAPVTRPQDPRPSSAAALAGESVPGSRPEPPAAQPPSRPAAPAPAMPAGVADTQDLSAATTHLAGVPVAGFVPGAGGPGGGAGRPGGSAPAGPGGAGRLDGGPGPGAASVRPGGSGGSGGSGGAVGPGGSGGGVGRSPGGPGVGGLGGPGGGSGAPGRGPVATGAAAGLAGGAVGASGAAVAGATVGGAGVAGAVSATGGAARAAGSAAGAAAGAAIPDSWRAPGRNVVPGGGAGQPGSRGGGAATAPQRPADDVTGSLGEPRVRPTGRRGKAAAGPRRARLVMRRIDPWSVLKFSLAFSICGVIVGVLAVAILYEILGGLGVFDSVAKFLDTITDAQSGSSTRKDFSSTIIIGGAAVLMAVGALLFTALATLGAFVYNLCASLTGGLEVTLAERS